MGWEESGRNWFLIQQGKAQRFTVEESYVAPLEKVQKNYSTKKRKAKGATDCSMIGLIREGFLDEWNEVRLEGGRKKELGGKYAWKPGRVALVYNPSTQETWQSSRSVGYI